VKDKGEKHLKILLLLDKWKRVQEYILPSHLVKIFSPEFFDRRKEREREKKKTAQLD